MNIVLVSDLHLEFHQYDPKHVWARLHEEMPSIFEEEEEEDGTDADEEEEEEKGNKQKKRENEILVLAGDIGDPFHHSYQNLLSMFRSRWTNIVLVAGNHEYYGHWIEETDLLLTKMCKNIGIHYLQRSVKRICGILFIGCTLWSEITEEHFLEMADSERIHDFNSHPLYWGMEPRNAVYLERHIAHRIWLHNKLQHEQCEGVPIVVVTHHLPSPRMNHPRFAPHTGFFSDLDYMLFSSSSSSSSPSPPSYVKKKKKNQLVLWCCGHTHESMVVAEDSLIVAANPLGYPEEKVEKATTCIDGYVFTNLTVEKKQKRKYTKRKTKAPPPSPPPPPPLVNSEEANFVN